MRFLLIVSPIAILVAAAISQSLFDNDLSDLSLFQDLPKDSLTLQEPSNDFIAIGGDFRNPEWTVDSDLSSGSGLMDFSSTAGSDPFDLEASCLTEDGQPLTKLRARQGQFCSPNGEPSSQPLELNPSRLFKIFFGPKEEPQTPVNPYADIVTPEDPEDPECRPDFPRHLCCQRPGELDTSIIANSFPGLNVYLNYFVCDEGV